MQGGWGPKLQGSHGTGQHPQHCQHHPQDADDAGEWGDHTIGGGGGYVAQGLVHIYIYIYIWETITFVGICRGPLFVLKERKPRSDALPFRRKFWEMELVAIG